MIRNGKNMEVKSMEDKTKFYNRKDLSNKDIVDLIYIWESYTGESFTDYCSFSIESDKSFLEFLEKEYPVLYKYHKEVARDGGIENTIQYVMSHCKDYITAWIPNDKLYSYNGQLKLVFYPLAEFILEDDTAWETFVDFFTSRNNTSNGTPYIDCYDIKKEFEDDNEE